MAGTPMHGANEDHFDASRPTGPAWDWFAEAFPSGPTRAQRLAWPAIDRGENVLLISPTGTGKTLAAFFSWIRSMTAEALDGGPAPGIRAVYVSPLKSLAKDVERNLLVPLEAIRGRLPEASRIRAAVRTGDTTAHHRRRMRESPPHLLITTPESLSLLLSQEAWRDHWRTVERIIVDEVHSLVPTKRGVDLTVTLERLASLAAVDPARVGLSATCRPPEVAADFLVGPTRACRIIDVSGDARAKPPEIAVETLLGANESTHRGTTYRRLIRRLGSAVQSNRTTLIFANTRAFTEKLTHDLRLTLDGRGERIAAHHGSLDAERRGEVEARLKAGDLDAVVTSTSLELGVDIGEADLSVLVGLPGSVSRCLQRVGRAGHRPDATTRGLILAATPGELVGAAVTSLAARDGRIEPVGTVRSPLDVLSQQLIALASLGETKADDAYALIKRAGPMADLSRADFDACLDALAGELPAPAGAYEPSPGAAPRWSSPRVWKSKGLFGIRSARARRWFWSNVGTIFSEESMPVRVGDRTVGRLESAYAERLQPGDRFVLDGRSLECRRFVDGAVVAVPCLGEPNLPRWTSDRLGLSNALAGEIASFRCRAAELAAESRFALRSWLDETYALDQEAAAAVESLIEAQEAISEVPTPDLLLIEVHVDEESGRIVLTFHAPLGRAACEALARATSARIGRKLGRDLSLSVADLGWSVRLPEGAEYASSLLDGLANLDGFEADVLEGVDRGELVASRFKHVAATGLMVLKNPEGGKLKVGGLEWVGRRLYPLVLAACPRHPLIREARREVLHDLLDTPAAAAWLASRPTIRERILPRPSPFASAWIEPSSAEAVRFESPAEALRRLHARLTGAPGGES